MTKEQILEIENFCDGHAISPKVLIGVYNGAVSKIAGCLENISKNDQQTASLYSREEVQKIVENVRSICAHLSNNYQEIESLDLNQFIPKK